MKSATTKRLYYLYCFGCAFVFIFTGVIFFNSIDNNFSKDGDAPLKKRNALPKLVPTNPDCPTFMSCPNAISGQFGCHMDDQCSTKICCFAHDHMSSCCIDKPANATNITLTPVSPTNSSTSDNVTGATPTPVNGTGTNVTTPTQTNGTLNGTASSNATTTGTNATATGTNATAAGTNATAAGTNATAAGTNATAAGTNATAAGTNATAAGTNATVAGTNGTATGTNDTSPNVVAGGTNSTNSTSGNGTSVVAPAIQNGTVVQTPVSNGNGTAANNGTVAGNGTAPVQPAPNPAG